MSQSTYLLRALCVSIISTHIGRSKAVADMFLDGKGEGFGNITSIQTVAVITAAKATRRVYKVDDNQPVSNYLYKRTVCRAKSLTCAM